MICVNDIPDRAAFALEFDKRAQEAKSKGLWLYQYDQEFTRQAVARYNGDAMAAVLDFNALRQAA